MKKITTAIVITLALLAGCDDKNKDDQLSAERHTKSATTYIKQGQLRAAVLEAQNAIRLQPDSASGYLILGDIYNEIGAYGTAQQVLGKVVDKMPAVANPLAESYLQTKKYRTAIDVINSHPADGDNKEAQIKQQEILALSNIYLGDNQAYERAHAQYKALGGDAAKLAYIEASYVLAQGKAEEAEAILEQSLGQAPDNVNNLRLLGAINAYKHQLEKAETYLTKALGVLPKTDVLSVERTETLTQLIDVLVQQGRTSEAYTYQKVLAEANPEGNAAQQRFNEALEYYQQGQFDKAEAILQELREQFPRDKNTATLLGMIEFQQGADKQAADLFDEYIDPETATSTVIQAAALVKYRSNKMDEAIELLKKAAESQPNDPAILATYGLAVLDRDDKSAEGAKALEKSLALNPNQQRIRIALAKRYIALGQPEQALGQLQKAYQEQPLDIIIQQSYFKLLLDQEEHGRIKEEIDLFKKNYPDSARGFLIEGWYLMSQQDYAGAEKAFERALSMPKNEEKHLAYSGLAQVYELQKNDQRAAAAWQQTIDANPQVSSPYLRWLKKMESLNRMPEAETFLKKLEKSGKNWQPSLVLAEITAKTGRLDDSIAHIEKALDISNRSPLVMKKAALLYQAKALDLKNKKQIPEARNYFMKAVKLYPENAAFLSNLIETELAAGNIPEAQKLLDQFVQTDENLAARYYLQGVIRFAEKNPEEGLKQLRLSWGVRPTDKVAESLFTYYQQNNMTTELDAFLDEWMEKIPDSYGGAFVNAINAQNKGDKQAAIKWYEKALSVAPATPVALNNLAWLYYETKDERALDLASKAAKLAPTSAAILDTYGWILVETGSVQQGVEVLQKAVDLSKDNAEIKSHLQQAKRKAGSE